jgi:hypothetical protein
MVLPKSETPNPKITHLVIFSFRKIGENIATHNGAVVTITTELDMDVYSSEVIHAAKCNPSKIPDNIKRRILLLGCLGNSVRMFFHENGTMTDEAIKSLPAAITSEGASS